MTPHLKNGRTDILVKVDHRNCPSSRWHSGSGIYRHVWLNALDPVHISTGGTLVSTQEDSSDHAQIQIHTQLENASGRNERVRVFSSVQNHEGKEIESIWSEWQVKKGESQSFSSEMHIENAQIWDIDHPYLYTRFTRLEVRGNVVDRAVTRFGMRSIHFDPDEGFFLNGNLVKMKGVNLHADGGTCRYSCPGRRLVAQVEKAEGILCQCNPVCRPSACPGIPGYV